jgi:antitoxin component YwqK of YwqJK toxin-antitoxin module
LAREKVTAFRKPGVKATSEFWLNRRLVGFVSWDEDGKPGIARGLRNGARVGHQIEYYDGTVSYVEPFEDGLVHGWAKQFDARGRLIFMSPFKHGTGTDYWCNEQGLLCEEHPLVAGKPSGWERWWNEDQKTVYQETAWLGGACHGIKREWTKGRLDHGFPQFFIRGQRVRKRKYLVAARRDPTLPPYRPEDDSPKRRLPDRFIELKRRVRSRRRK